MCHHQSQPHLGMVVGDLAEQVMCHMCVSDVVE